MTKVLYLLILLPYLMTGAEEIVYREGILAKVNGKVITNYELNAMTIREQRKISRMYSPDIAKMKIAEFKQQALETYIDNVIILDEFKTKGFTIPQALIDKDLNDDIRYRANGDQTKFAALLDAGGISMEEYREQIRDSIAIEMMKNQNVNMKVSVTPIEISRYYDENISKFSTNKEVRTAILRIAKEGKSQPEFDKKVSDIIAAVKEKKDFAKLADDFSEMPDKTPGGDLGFQKVEELNPLFKEVISKLNVGEVSDPIEINKDKYFLKLTAEKGGSPKELSEVRDFIKAVLRDQKRQEYYKEFITILRKKASIEDFTKK
ncbi:MAG: SurA N-terminal domain-containing protein [Lentisphaeraceae bacterium]|nr:SurA N-terminal domain-containing protein [Lentisphaeraceae bacterium]